MVILNHYDGDSHKASRGEGCSICIAVRGEAITLSFSVKKGGQIPKKNYIRIAFSFFANTLKMVWKDYWYSN